MSANKTSPTVKKAKLHSIIEAASALTALNDEETKRYIPEHKKPDAALTFPEKLMSMMRFAEKHAHDEGYCVAWLKDGKSFVIRDADAFTRNIIPQFFKSTKFSSFTRKLYRWGFRQVNRGIGPDDPIIFGNEFFQRDHADLMAKMRSITAGNITESGKKKRRASNMQEDEDHDRKRFMYAQRGMDLALAGGAKQGANNTHLPMALNLSNALRPNFTMLHQMQHLQQQQEHQKRLSLQLSNFQHVSNMQQQQQFNNMFLPQQQHLQMQQQQMNFHQQHLQGIPPFPSAATAEIVNAAISALRYAS